MQASSRVSEALSKVTWRHKTQHMALTLQASEPKAWHNALWLVWPTPDVSFVWKPAHKQWVCATGPWSGQIQAQTGTLWTCEPTGGPRHHISQRTQRKVWCTQQTCHFLVLCKQDIGRTSFLLKALHYLFYSCLVSAVCSGPFSPVWQLWLTDSVGISCPSWQGNPSPQLGAINSLFSTVIYVDMILD